MGWAEDARQKRRAPVGLYEPERYTVTVYDTFQQYKLRMAALAIANGTSPTSAVAPSLSRVLVVAAGLSV